MSIKRSDNYDVVAAKLLDAKVRKENGEPYASKGECNGILVNEVTQPHHKKRVKGQMVEIMEEGVPVFYHYRDGTTNDHLIRFVQATIINNNVTNVTSEENRWEISSTDFLGNTLVDADVDNILIKKTGGQFYIRKDLDGKIKASEYGIKGNTPADQYPAFQGLINKCIKHGVGNILLPPGKLRLSQGVVIRRPIGFTGSRYATLSIYGAGNSYDYTLGAGTGLEILNPTECCIYIQTCKGVEIKDISFFGQNTFASSITVQQFFDDHNGLNANGCLDTATASHSGVAIDVLYNGSVANKHPQKLAYYVEDGQGGSTQIKITDCYFADFVTGIRNSGAGMQNGENIFYTRPFFARCKVCISNGDIQNRTVVAQDLLAWGWIGTVADSTTYGNGCPITIRGANLAAYVNRLVRIGSWYANHFAAYDVHAELLRNIGGCFEGTHGKISLHNCKLFFQGHQDNMRRPIIMVQCDQFTAYDTLLTYYSMPQSSFGISTLQTCLMNCNVSAPLLDINNQGQRVTHINTRLEGLGRYLEELTTINSTTQFATILNVDPVADTWQFNDSTGTVTVGMYVRLYPKNQTVSQLTGEYAHPNTLFIPAGAVTAKVGTLCTVTAVPYQLANGQEVDVYAFLPTLQTT